MGRRLCHRSYRCSPLSFDLDDLPAAGGAIRRGAEPRVLPAPRRPQARARDRADLRGHAELFASADVERLRELDGARPATTRGAAFATCSSSRSTGCSASRPGPRRRSSPGSRHRSRSNRAMGRSRTARCRSSRPTSRRRERRAALEEARNAVLDERLNPLHLTALERSHELCRALGWPSYADGLRRAPRDRPRRARRARARDFLEATEDVYATRRRSPSWDARGCPRWGSSAAPTCRASFAPRTSTPAFPADRLVASFADTARRARDRPARPGERPPRHRAPPNEVTARLLLDPSGCPDEVYLVIAPIGGRDDYAALFHEGGHTEHYANTDPGLAFEFRHLGDNSVTESFAFLFEHLHRGPRLASPQARARGPWAGGRARARREAGVPAPLRGQARLRARAARPVGRPVRDARPLLGAA